MQCEDLLLDRVLGNDAINSDCSFLADTVGTVGRLVFDGWIPSWIHMNHIVGRSQIETRSARLERD